MSRVRVLLAAFAAITLSVCGCAFADDSLPVLRWGGDSEGNVPYMFKDPSSENPDKSEMIGVEVDIVNALAKRMGVKPEFVHNGWDNLIPGLDLGLYDIALSGLEITPEHMEEVDFSLPYYRTFLQLVVQKGNPQKIETLENCVGKRVGTLKQSYAFFTLADAGVDNIRTYDNEVNAYQDMANDRLDAVLLDSPIAIYYAGYNTDLQFVGKPIGQIDYGIPVRKGNTELLEKVNAALVSIRDDGTLRGIYDRWNMWTPVMAEYFNDNSPAKYGPDKFTAWSEYQRKGLTIKQRFDRYLSMMPNFGKAAIVTMQVSISAMLLAISFGMILAVIRLFAPKFLSRIATTYIEVVRGTPVLIQLFFIFYGLPNIGIKLTPFCAGIVGLGLNYSAYEAENYRAGLLSVPASQMEGSLALGMTKAEALRYVVIPQAIRISLPPVTNDFISLLKDSSLVSMITLIDLTKAYGQLANTYYDYFGIGIIVAVIYFLLGLPFVRLARFAERKLAVAVRGSAAKVRSGARHGGLRAASYHH